jgi:hypothetical protein
MLHNKSKQNKVHCTNKLYENVCVHFDEPFIFYVAVWCKKTNKVSSEQVIRRSFSTFCSLLLLLNVTIHSDE